MNKNKNKYFIYYKFNFLNKFVYIIIIHFSFTV